MVKKSVSNPAVHLYDLSSGFKYIRVKIVGTSFPCRLHLNSRRSVTIKDFFEELGEEKTLKFSELITSGEVEELVRKDNSANSILKIRSINDLVHLIREKDNIYDSNAISVRVWNGFNQKYIDVGYLPKELSKEIANEKNMYVLNFFKDGLGMSLDILFSPYSLLSNGSSTEDKSGIKKEELVIESEFLSLKQIRQRLKA